MIPQTLRSQRCSGKGGARRDRQQREPAVELFGQAGQQLAVPAQHLGGVGQVIEDGPGDDGADIVAPELERRHRAEVAAAAAQRPEQVRVLVLAGGDERAVGQDHVGGQQVVDGEPVAPGQVADPAAQGQPADTRGGQDPGRGGQAECASRVIDVTPDAAAVGAHGLRRRVHGDSPHRRQVDHERVVPHAQATRVVTAAAHGDSQPPFAGVPDGGHDVGYVGAAGDRGRTAVDHRVVDRA